MKEIKAPDSLEGIDLTKTIFLAGSIAMGKAINWQEQVVEALKDTNYIILNPRRDNWDSSWEQDITNPLFREQVEWELDAHSKANVVGMNFDPDTKCPITLLELGIFKTKPGLIVCCPEGFWRKGNVDIVCSKYKIKQVSDLEELIKVLLELQPKDKQEKNDEILL